MKKFKDLIFEQHGLAKSYPSDIPDILDYSDMVQAKMTFDNSNTISVVGGGPSYGDGIVNVSASIKLLCPFTPIFANNKGVRILQ